MEAVAAISLSTIAIGIHSACAENQNNSPTYQTDPKGEGLAIDSKGVRQDANEIIRLLQHSEKLEEENAYAAAADKLEAVLPLLKRLLGSDHYRIGTTLDRLANIYSKMQAVEKAENLYLQAISILIKSQEADPRYILTSLDGLANLYDDLGIYAKSIQSRKISLEIREKIYGPHSTEITSTLQMLAGYSIALGNYEESERLFKRSITILRHARTANQAEQCSVILGLGEMYFRLGKPNKAEEQFTAALSCLNQSKLKEEASLATIGLSRTRLLLRDYRKAKEYAFKAHELTKGGSSPRSTLLSLIHLVYISLHNKEYKEAEGHLRKALAIEPKMTDNISINGVNAAATAFYFATEDYSRANEYNNLVLNYYEERSLRDLPEYSFFKSRAGLINALLGRYQLSSRAAQEGLEIELKQLTRIASLIPRSSRQDYQRLWNRDVDDQFIALAEKSPTTRDLAMRILLNKRGFLIDLERRQALLAESQGSKALQEERVDLIRRLSSIKIRKEIRKSIQDQLDRVESELYRALPALKVQQVENEAISSTLPSSGILIEFKKLMPFDQNKFAQSRKQENRYYALILTAKGSISQVVLDQSSDYIDKAISDALQASALNNSDTQKLWAEVSDLVLKPLLPKLSRSDQWFITPDAELNRIPFAALPSPLDPSKSLNQTVRLRILTTGRDLLRLQQPATSAQALAVVANPDFGRQERLGPAVVIASNNDQSQSRSADLGAKNWEPLPASEREGQQIAALLGTQPITGTNATTSRLQTLKSPRVLHIASHGFFVGDVENKHDDPLFALQDQSAMLQPFRGENPQLRSGIVLAGANQPDADPNDDGYLTAAEAVGLQLDGTELVVLSACNTGQGDIQTGEGVYGLQRSLTVAGARSTLLSLWKVDDAATAEFMTRFYTRLKAGEGRSDALAATQKEFRSGLAGDGAWKEPYYWAAWQLVGDWRPIKGL